MQSGPDAIDRSRFIMIFVTILEVTEICLFRLVLEGKACKEIPGSSRLEFLEMCSANNFASLDAEDSTSDPSNRGSMVDLSLLRTLLAIRKKSREPNFCEVMDFCFISICTFGTFKNPFATILTLLNFTLDSENLFCWYKRKKRFFWQLSSWKPWEIICEIVCAKCLKQVKFAELICVNCLKWLSFSSSQTSSQFQFCQNQEKYFKSLCKESIVCHKKLTSFLFKSN